MGLTARSYPIAYNTAISSGQVVKLSAGKVVSAVAAETSPILGIAAENHPGVPDALNYRANGPEILVYDSPELIFECMAPVITAASGSATTIVPAEGDVAAAAANDAFNDSVLMLISKAEGSTNTDLIGKKIPVTDYTASGTVIAKASGGAPSAGDRYEVYPKLGAAVGGIASLDASGFSRLVLTAKGAAKIKCVGHDYERGMVRLMAVEHTLGSEE